MIKRYDVSDYVKLKLNVDLRKLSSIMQRCKVYFHPLPEHFGISIVEAMSAGLIPVVPSIGGQTEFVPKKYQFNSLLDAADIIKSSMNATEKERISISNSVRNFSLSKYVGHLKKFVSKTISIANI